MLLCAEGSARVFKSSSNTYAWKPSVKFVITGFNTDIDYNGISGPVEFNEKGDPSEASVGIYEYGADNRYTFVEAKAGKI